MCLVLHVIAEDMTSILILLCVEGDIGKDREHHLYLHQYNVVGTGSYRVPIGIP